MWFSGSGLIRGSKTGCFASGSVVLDGTLRPVLDLFSATSLTLRLRVGLLESEGNVLRLVLSRSQEGAGDNLRFRFTFHIVEEIV